MWYSARPEAYACKPAAARVVSCGTAPYYKDANNKCAGHGPDQPSSNGQGSLAALAQLRGRRRAAREGLHGVGERREKQKFMDALIAAVK